MHFELTKNKKQKKCLHGSLHISWVNSPISVTLLLLEDCRNKWTSKMWNFWSGCTALADTVARFSALFGWPVCLIALSNLEFPTTHSKEAYLVDYLSGYLAQVACFFFSSSFIVLYLRFILIMFQCHCEPKFPALKSSWL